MPILSKISRLTKKGTVTPYVSLLINFKPNIKIMQNIDKFHLF